MTERSEGYEHSASKAGTGEAVASRGERSEALSEFMKEKAYE